MNLEEPKKEAFLLPRCNAESVCDKAAQCAANEENIHEEKEKEKIEKETKEETEEIEVQKEEGEDEKVDKTEKTVEEQTTVKKLGAQQEVESNNAESEVCKKSDGDNGTSTVRPCAESCSTSSLLSSFSSAATSISASFSCTSLVPAFSSSSGSGCSRSSSSPPPSSFIASSSSTSSSSSMSSFAWSCSPSSTRRLMVASSSCPSSHCSSSSRAAHTPKRRLPCDVPDCHDDANTANMDEGIPKRKKPKTQSSGESSVGLCTEAHVGTQICQSISSPYLTSSAPKGDTINDIDCKRDKKKSMEEEPKNTEDVVSALESHEKKEAEEESDGAKQIFRIANKSSAVKPEGPYSSSSSSWSSRAKNGRKLRVKTASIAKEEGGDGSDIDGKNKNLKIINVEEEVIYADSIICNEKNENNEYEDLSIPIEGYQSNEDSAFGEIVYDELCTETELEESIRGSEKTTAAKEGGGGGRKNERENKKKKEKMTLRELAIRSGYEPPPHIFSDNVEIACYKCKMVHSEEDLGNMLVCDGSCQRIFHHECVGMGKAKMVEGNNSRWKCQDCEDGLLNCSFCGISRNRRRLSKCSYPLCRSFYCFPECVSKLRVITGGERIRKLLQVTYNHTEGMYDDKGRARFICPVHVCWSCYDSGKYRYIWERNWKKLAKTDPSSWHSRAYNSLKKSTRGMLEARYFERNPPRYARLPSLLAPLMCTLERCVRCSRAWCKNCWHPDSQILLASSGAALCQHCVHAEVNKKFMTQFPEFALKSETPDDLMKEIEGLLCNPDAAYRVDVGVRTIDADRNWYPGESDLVDEKTAGRGVCEDITSVKSGGRGQEEDEENEEKNIEKYTSDFTMITSNYIDAKYYHLLKAGDRTQGVICTCEERCSSSCENRMAHVQCNPKNCRLGQVNCGNRQFSRSHRPRLKLRTTEGKGVGLFAMKDFMQGDLVVEYVGEVISEDVHKARCNQRAFDELELKQGRHWYVLEAARGVYIDSTIMGNISRFANHSCDPNAETFCFVVNGLYRVGIFAKRHIKPGEEVTYDYRFDSTGIGGGFECKCGAANCRRVIGHTSRSLQCSEIENMIDIQSDRRACFEELASALINKNHANPYMLRVSQCNPIVVLEKQQAAEKGDRNNHYSIGGEDGGSGAGEARTKQQLEEDKWESERQPFAFLLDKENYRNNAVRNYVKALALNGRTVEEWDRALTKKFGIDIPWAIFVNQLNNAQLEAARECSMAFNEMYVRARRYLTRQVLLLVKKCHGRRAFETMQSILDETWGSTEVCAACGYPGLVQICDYCADTFHVDEQCCDWVRMPDGDVVCGICGNDDHRSRWWNLTEVEREALSDLANKERTKRVIKDWEEKWMPKEGEKLPDPYSTTLYSTHDLANMFQLDGNYKRVFSYSSNRNNNSERHAGGEEEEEEDEEEWEEPWCFQ